MRTLKDQQLAVTTALATFGLLIAGGLVHATESGLACPTWPGCFDRFGFFPQMVGGVAFEHSHRLIAGGVALLTLALARQVWTQRKEHGALRYAGLVAFVIVLIQALLGGATVLLRLPIGIKIMHLGTSMIFFSTVTWLSWRLREGAMRAPIPSSQSWVWAAALAVYVQILLGASVRHFNAGLACTDFPLCEGVLWGDLALMKIHMAHRYGALAATGLVIYASVKALRSPGRDPLSSVLPVTAVLVSLVQVFLGIASVITALAPWMVTLHLACGAALLANMVSILAVNSTPTVGAETPGTAESVVGVHA